MPERIYYAPQETPLLKKLFYRFRPNAVPVGDFPEDVLFETVSGCNARCTFCPNGNGGSKIPQGRMDWELFTKIIDESLRHPVKRISPYLMNEPLLDRGLAKKIRYIADRRTNGVSLKINTNAALLDEEAARGLIDSGLDRLNISCHGISKVAYEESMKGLRLETTLANVDRFLELRRAAGCKKPRVTVTMVKTKIIEQEIPQIKQYWGARGVSVHIRQLENRASAAIAGKGIEASGWKNFSWCKRLFSQANILTNGDMILCCVDYGYTTVLGNVGQTSLKDVWNSEKARDIRRRFLRGDMEGLLCGACLKEPA